MLVLSRKVNQRIVLKVGEGLITVRLVATCGDGKARIGVEAPQGVHIIREEICDEETLNLLRETYG